MAMQSMTQIMDGINTACLPELPPERKPTTISQRDARVVNTVFDRLQVIFPAWQRAFPTPEALKSARQEWTKALVEAGVVTEQALAIGFRAAREKDIPFFPSPGMFIKWCQPSPEALGLPSVPQALNDIARHRETHPAVILAARATRFERSTLTAAEYEPVFARHYEILVKRVLAGEDLSVEVPKALPSQQDITHSPEFYVEAGKRGVASLKKLFGKAVTQ